MRRAAGEKAGWSCAAVWPGPYVVVCRTGAKASPAAAVGHETRVRTWSCSPDAQIFGTTRCRRPSLLVST